MVQACHAALAAGVDPEWVHPIEEMAIHIKGSLERVEKVNECMQRIDQAEEDSDYDELELACNQAEVIGIDPLRVAKVREKIRVGKIKGALKDGFLLTDPVEMEVICDEADAHNIAPNYSSRLRRLSLELREQRLEELP